MKALFLRLTTWWQKATAWVAGVLLFLGALCAGVLWLLSLLRRQKLLEAQVAALQQEQVALTHYSAQVTEAAREAEVGVAGAAQRLQDAENNHKIASERYDARKAELKALMGSSLASEWNRAMRPTGQGKP